MALGSVGDARLQKEIEDLERLFTIDTEKLKKITDHFFHELEKGLTAEGGSIVSFPFSPPGPPLTEPAHEPNMGHVIPHGL